MTTFSRKRPAPRAPMNRAPMQILSLPRAPADCAPTLLLALPRAPADRAPTVLLPPPRSPPEFGPTLMLSLASAPADCAPNVLLITRAPPPRAPLPGAPEGYSEELQLPLSERHSIPNSPLQLVSQWFPKQPLLLPSGAPGDPSDAARQPAPTPCCEACRT